MDREKEGRGKSNIFLACVLVAAVACRASASSPTSLTAAASVTASPSASPPTAQAAKRGLAGVTPQMLSLFTPDEYELDRYAAALAATEWLRKERDAVIRENTNPLAYLALKLTKGDQYTKWMASPWVSEISRRAQSNYLRQAGRVITDCDLSITRFNQLSKDVAHDRTLRNRVTQQAYLYRVAAELHGDKIPPVEDLRDSRRAPGAPRRRKRSRGGEGGAAAGNGTGQEGVRMPMPTATMLEPEARVVATAARPSKIALFAKSLREIEELRLDHRKRLMETLECDDLPVGLCKPTMGKITGPTVRRACEYFPVVAESIVRSNGLRAEDFNRMMGRTRRDVLFRYKVLRHVRRLDKGFLTDDI